MIDVDYEAVMPWPVREVARALRDLPWTFPRADGETPQPGRFSADLQVPLGAKGSVSHQATVELGEFERNAVWCRVPMTITATSRFPTFRGSFEGRDVLGETVLTLTGECRVPLGIAGRMGDAAGGSMVRASMRRFFETVVKALKADLQATASPWPPAIMPESLHDA